MIELRWEDGTLFIKRGHHTIGWIEHKAGTLCRFEAIDTFNEAEALGIWGTMRRLNRGQVVEDGTYTGPTLANALSL
jgi:hypothetical protein